MYNIKIEKKHSYMPSRNRIFIAGPFSIVCDRYGYYKQTKEEWRINFRLVNPIRNIETKEKYILKRLYISNIKAVFERFLEVNPYEIIRSIFNV